MRTLKLTMSAFGPYSKEEEVDFTKLGQSGIYLICGDTGSGKTTIFDAIVFALYGEASGSERDSGMFRSKYADSDRQTFVKLAFELRGKEYTVIRNPEYMRPKTRGEGYTKEPADATLTLPDTSVVCGSRNVTEYCTKLLGVSREQFSKTAMIAQGDFRKLLFADTTERVKIFRDIFKTIGYSRMEEKLKERMSTAKAEYDTVIGALSESAGRLGCPETHPSYEIINRMARAGASNGDELLSAAQALCNDYKAEFEAAQEKLDKAEEALKSAELEKSLAQKLIDDINKLEELRVTKSTLSSEYEKTKSELEKQNSKSDEVSELANTASLLEAGLADYDKRAELLQTLEKLNDKLVTSKREADELNRSINELKNSLSEAKASFEQLGEMKAELERVRAAHESSLRRKNDIEKLITKCNSLETAESKYASALEEYKKASDTALQARERLSLLEKAFFDAQAGILARSLKADTPCPVCGSLTHPSPAPLSDEDVDKQTLDTVKNDTEKLIDAAAEASRRAGEFKSEYEHKKASFDAAFSELMKTSTDTSAKDAIFAEHKSAKENAETAALNVNTLKAAILKAQAVADSIPEKEMSVSVLENKLVNKKSECSATEASINALRAQLEAIVTKHTTKNEAEKEIAHIKLSILQTKEQLDALLKKEREQSGEILKLDGEIRALENLVSGKALPDIDAFNNNLHELNKVRSELSQKRDVAFENSTRTSSELEKIRRHTEKYALTANRYIMLKELSDTANGSLTGKEKLRLETFVQTAYLDKVLYFANLRLLNMTGSRYELVRRSDEKALARQSGLELDVRDHYNGTIRSVKSLSGGEVFMASLSLALGMSDEIEASASGIKLDSLFIDEGFGSLDSETLSKAMSVLDALHASERSIGIISHVEELKNRIDKKITVIKLKDGTSTVRVDA